MLRGADKRLLIGGQISAVQLGQRYWPLLPHAMANYDAIVLANSPVAYWKFNEASGTVLDYSGNGNDLSTVTGTPDYQYKVGPLRGSGLHCAASEAIGRTSPVSTATNNFTIEGWFYPVTYPTSNDQSLLYNGNPASNGWGFAVDANLTVQYFAGGVALGGNSVSFLRVGVWNHVMVVRNAGTWSYYINGALDSSTPGTTAPNAPSGGLAGIRSEGARDVVYAYAAIYNSALGATNALQRYQAIARDVVGVSGPRIA